MLPATGTDSLIYHLTLPAYWLQYGYLKPLDLPFQPGTVEQPMFAETIAYVLLYLFKSDTWVWLIQPLFLLHLLWLFFCTSRKLGAPAAVAAALTAHIALFTPFTRNIAIFNNDVILAWAAALFGWGMCQRARAWRRGLFFAAAGLGLMMATKMVGVIYAAAGFTAAALFLLTSGALSKTRVSSPYMTILVAVLLFLAGGCFLLRNFLLHGNPFYPNEVRLGGHLIFPGLYDLSAVAGNTIALSDLFALFLAGEGFAASLLDGPAFALAIMVLLFIACRGNSLPRRGILTLFWPLLAGGLYFALFPNWPDPRFLFPLYYGLWLATAHAASLCCLSSRRRVLGIILGWLALRFYFLTPIGLWPWALAAVALGMMFSAPQLARLIPLGVGIAALGLFCSAPWWLDEYKRQREIVRPRAWETLYRDYGRAWRRIWEMSRAKALCIAYTGTPWLFPLFGPNLENRVLYVPISAADQPQPVTLRPGEWPVKPLLHKRRGMSEDNFWLEAIRRENVDILMVCDNSDYGGAMPERAMIGRHAEMFRLLFAAGEVRLYEVQKGP